MSNIAEREIKAVYTTKEAAHYLGVSVTTFWRLVAKGLIEQGLRYSCRKRVWRKEMLDKFLNTVEQEQTEE